MGLKVGSGTDGWVAEEKVPRVRPATTHHTLSSDHIHIDFLAFLFPN